VHASEDSTTGRAIQGDSGEAGIPGRQAFGRPFLGRTTDDRR